jgi:hypothetical protein
LRGGTPPPPPRPLLPSPGHLEVSPAGHAAGGCRDRIGSPGSGSPVKQPVHHASAELRQRPARYMFQCLPGFLTGGRACRMLNNSSARSVVGWHSIVSRCRQESNGLGLWVGYSELTSFLLALRMRACVVLCYCCLYLKWMM